MAGSRQTTSEAKSMMKQRKSPSERVPGGSANLVYTGTGTAAPRAYMYGLRETRAIELVLTSIHHLDGRPSLAHGHLTPRSVAPIHC